MSAAHFRGLQAPDSSARAAGRRRSTTNIGPTSRGGFPAGPISHVPFVLRFMPRRAGLTPPVYRQPRRAAQEIPHARSEEHTSELQSLMRISYAVFCLKKKKKMKQKTTTDTYTINTNTS